MSEEKVIYQVYVNDNNPQTAGIYPRKIIQEKVDPMTDTPYIYQIDAIIPFGLGFSSDWIDRTRLCCLQSWGPNNSSHQWLTTDRKAAQREFKRLVNNARNIWVEKLEEALKTYEGWKLKGRNNHDLQSELYF